MGPPSSLTTRTWAPPSAKCSSSSEVCLGPNAACLSCSSGEFCTLASSLQDTETEEAALSTEWKRVARTKQAREVISRLWVQTQTGESTVQTELPDMSFESLFDDDRQGLPISHISNSSTSKGDGSHRAGRGEGGSSHGEGRRRRPGRSHSQAPPARTSNTAPRPEPGGFHAHRNQRPEAGKVWA